MKSLLLEDDIGLGDIMSEYLEDNDFELDLVYDGEEALDKAYETKYDLYIFDVNVPAIKGFDVLKTLRDNGDATPTIFVTSLNDIDDVSKGFESGADDYLKKPFELAELLLRIKNIQKRSFTQKRSTVIQIDKDITFDIDTGLYSPNSERLDCEELDGRFESDNPSGKTLMMDTNVEGSDERFGLSPKALMLSALAGCTGLDVVSVLDKMKVSNYDFKMEVTGELKEEHPKYYHKVKLDYHFHGKDLD